MYKNDVDYVLPVLKEEVSSSPKSRKKMWIIILAVVLVLATAFICLLFFTDNGIEGDWELTVNPERLQSSADQIDDRQRVYYEFTAPGEYGDGKYTTYFDSGVEQGQYKLSQKDGVDYIDMGTGELEYKITGFKLFGNAKITITLPETTNEQTGQKTDKMEYIFEQEKAPDYNGMSYDDYKTDTKLLNKWITNDRALSYFQYSIPYTQTVEFVDNGIMTIHYKSSELYLDRTMYYAYTSENNKLTFSLVTDPKTKYTVEYTFDADSNLKFKNDKTGSSIFSDAFFGDATFYTKANLPKTTQAPTEESTAD